MTEMQPQVSVVQQVLERRAPLRGLAVMAFIFFLGPVIGALLLLGPAFLFGPGETNPAATPPAVPTQDALSTRLNVALFILMFSHLFGGAQALVAGVWLGLRTFWRGGFGYIEAAVAALVASGLWGLYLLQIVSDTESPLNGGFVVVLSVLGVVSALICRWLLRRFCILPR